MMDQIMLLRSGSLRTDRNRVSRNLIRSPSAARLGWIFLGRRTSEAGGRAKSEHVQVQQNVERADNLIHGEKSNDKFEMRSLYIY